MNFDDDESVERLLAAIRKPVPITGRIRIWITDMWYRVTRQENPYL